MATATRWPHLSGDLDAKPALLDRLERLAASKGDLFNITSGRRTAAEQANLRAHPQGFPVAGGTSKHQTGDASDVFVNGRPIWQALSAKDIAAAGLTTYPGGQTADPVHVELPAGTSSRVASGALDAAKILSNPVTAPVEAAKQILDAGGNVVNEQAAKLAKDAIGALFGDVKQDGLRALMYVLLVGAGATLAVVGVARATGVGQKLRQAAVAAAAVETGGLSKAVV